MEVTSLEVVRGTAPDPILFDRSGYGYGYGDGSGSGYGDGSGDGYGYGYGDGYGYGYGYGDGDGYGDGSGDGSGYGYGYGYGYGSGDGYGNGSGDGYGDGDGDGDGYGDGSEEYWLSTIDAFASKWTDIMRDRLTTLRREGAVIAFWRSDDDGMPSNGGKRIEAAAAGVIHTAPGPLNLRHGGTLHATVLPTKWKGDRWWIVAMIGKTTREGDKIGALKREIIGECL